MPSVEAAATWNGFSPLLLGARSERNEKEGVEIRGRQIRLCLRSAFDT